MFSSTPEKLIEVYNDTMEYCKHRRFSPDKDNLIINIPKNLLPVEVHKEDILSGVVTMKRMGYNPLLINMGNQWYPGSGVYYGIKAQEEELFRRTNLHILLHNSEYPLCDNKILYVKNAAIIKDENYQILDNPIYFSSITLSGIISFHSRDTHTWKEKIRLILLKALEYGHDSVVIGAWNSGGYHRPLEIAKCFYDVILIEKWNLKYIRFSMLDTLAYSHFDRLFQPKKRSRVVG